MYIWCLLCARLYNEWYTVLSASNEKSIAGRGRQRHRCFYWSCWYRATCIFAKRSIFTWHSMPLAQTFFLSFTFFSLLRPFLHSWRLGQFFLVAPFFSHLCYFMALRSFKHHQQFQMDCLCVRLGSALTSGGLHVTCSLRIHRAIALVFVCDFRCTITRVHTFVRTRRITPKRRWKW